MLRLNLILKLMISNCKLLYFIDFNINISSAWAAFLHNVAVWWFLGKTISLKITQMKEFRLIYLFDSFAVQLEHFRLFFFFFIFTASVITPLCLGRAEQAKVKFRCNSGQTDAGRTDRRKSKRLLHLCQKSLISGLSGTRAGSNSSCYVTDWACTPPYNTQTNRRTDRQTEAQPGNPLTSKSTSCCKCFTTSFSCFNVTNLKHVSASFRATGINHRPPLIKVETWRQCLKMSQLVAETGAVYQMTGTPRALFLWQWDEEFLSTNTALTSTYSPFTCH